MNQELRVYKLAGEYCSRLGLPVPEIRVQGGTLSSEPYKHTRYLGYCHYGVLRDGDLPYILINSRGQGARAIRETVAHEVIHYAFRKLKHGPDFDARAKALMEGHLFFRGRMLDGRGKVDILDRTPFVPKPSFESKAEMARAKVKALDAKIKRLDTIRSKWQRRVRIWEKKAAERSKPGART